MSVTFRNVAMPLDEFAVDVDVALRAQTTAICGPSGAGKTTLLELIAGLRSPERGSIQIGDHCVFDAEANINVPPRLRRSGYVPQDDALFPHLSARANILYAASTSGPLATEHVEEILEIAPFASRSIQRLSGGERKRIALARALLSAPQVLLLDEPLTGLHDALRQRVLQYLVRVRDELRVPMIYVTHDADDAAALCSEVVFVDRGRVIRHDILSA